MKASLAILAILAYSAYFASAEIGFFKKASGDLHLGFEPQYPRKLANSLAFKKFIKLAEENKLNISVVVTNNKKWNNANLKETTSLKLDFPLVNEIRTEPTLNKEIGDKFLSVASEEKLSASSTRAVSSGATNFISNNPHGVVHSFLRDTHGQFTKGHINGPTIADHKSYAAQFVLVHPDAEGNNLTTKVLLADVNIKVVDSEGLDKDTIAYIKHSLSRALFEYADELITRVVVQKLDQEYSEGNWQGVDAGKLSDLNLSYLKTNKYVVFTVNNDEHTYVFFSI